MSIKNNIILVSGSIAYDYVMSFPDYFKNHILANKIHNLNVNFSIDKLNKAVHNVPASIEIKIARLKLKALGVNIDKLSSEQKKYLASWEVGT